MALRRRVRPDAESDSVSDLTLDSLKQALGDAGFEIYRIDGDDIRVAERVRMHLMESGVVVCCDDTPHVALTVRGQRSDFPSINESELFERVRDTFAPQMSERGFEERSASTREINNPADVFVHYSQIIGDGFRTLEEGMTVQFELKEGPKGLFAENVSKVES